MSDTSTKVSTKAIEIELLLEAVFRRYGLDFRNYAFPSIKRRIRNAMLEERLATISQLQEKILHDVDCMERFLLALTVNVTSLFRDPTFYLALMSKYVPMLTTDPFLRNGHVGLCTGAEGCS